MVTARGFFGIGIYRGKTAANLGTLWRSCHAFGVDFMFTVGSRYQHQASDTVKAPRHVPLYHYKDVDDLVEHLPYGCPLVGVELDERSSPLTTYRHRPRAAYLLGAEDNGLPPKVLDRCHELVVIPGASRCLNVSVAGSIVIYDRVTKEGLRATPDLR